LCGREKEKKKMKKGSTPPRKRKRGERRKKKPNKKRNRTVFPLPGKIKKESEKASPSEKKKRN